jgi:hypothetical protein
MTPRIGSIREAYAVLGLDPGAGFDAAKSAFRDAAKKLHPDITPPSPDTLSELADIVAAIRYLEAHRPACLELQISATEAASGITKALKYGDKPIIVRIPAGVCDGASLTAVGDDSVQVQISVLAGEDAPMAAPDSAALEDFVDTFSRPSPMSRFARWIRNSNSAA